MKNKLFVSLVIINFIMVEITNAQWYLGGIPNSNFAHLLYPGWPNDAHAVAIGDFDTPGLLPNAFFHINTNLSTLPASGIASLGEMFHSDCPQDISTYWRQLRGGIEYGVVYSLSPSDDYTGTTTGEGHHFYIQSSYRDLDGLAGDLRFNTGGPNPRMRILGVSGFTGFGDYTVFRPQNLVHLHDNINETNSTYAQWTNPTSNANSTDGLLIGNIALTAEIIQQEFASLNFSTSSLPRMQIFDGSGSGIDGNVGIGDFTVFNPQNLLHQHTVNVDLNYHQFTTYYTTAAANCGGLIGMNRTPNPYNPVGPDYSPFELIQYERAPILFHSTNTSLPAGTISERMRIVERPGFNWPGTPAQNITKVTINRAVEVNTVGGGLTGMNFLRPIAMLNIGYDLNVLITPTNWAGNRLWMDVGVYDNFQSDNMYVGLKQEGPEDNVDAVVNWGDNIPGSSNNDGIQNLRFIFTALGTPASTYATAPASTQNGLEVARMTSNGNVGIGDFYNNAVSPLQPAARLEIIDAKDLTTNYPNNSRNEPQLRLSFNPGRFPLGVASFLAIRTDFRTTNLGDLYIHPVDAQTGTNVERFVGINDATPGNTLEITSNLTLSPELAGFTFY